MGEFQTPVDIANRALQHCGAEMIDATIGFAEVSKRARQTSFVYGKLRRAELRRNIWRFAIRRAVLRPLDTNTLLLAPTLWVATTTYFVGSIVSDQSNNLWISRIPNNLNNQPQNSTTWEPYFGPLSVMLYDSSTTYSTGEVVYTAAGDGTYNTYQSQFTNNPVHPALPNQWSILTTYFKNDVVQSFPAWAGGTTYTQGQTVLYTDGLIYSSLQNGNLNHTPATSPTFWVVMPILTLQSQQVPVTGTNLISPLSRTPVGEWSISATYVLGNFVMFNGIEYLSILNNNTGNFPNAAASTFWVPVTLGTFYMSTVDLNIGNNPATQPALWLVSTTYAAGNNVTGSDGVIYSSIGSGNIGHDPTLSPTFWTNTGKLNPWTTAFIQGGGNSLWLQIGGASFPNRVALSGLNITYPIGTGPSSQITTRNIYKLPAGFLRMAPQDPKAGSHSIIGAPSGLLYHDWDLEEGVFVSSETQPIVIRFVVDMNDVTRMDDMFCEGLAARIALEVCEPLTQSSDKLKTIMAEYEKFMTEARMVNGIETGAEEPPIDDWISSRL